MNEVSLGLLTRILQGLLIYLSPRYSVGSQPMIKGKIKGANFDKFYLICYLIHLMSHESNFENAENSFEFEESIFS